MSSIFGLTLIALFKWKLQSLWILDIYKDLKTDITSIKLNCRYVLSEYDSGCYINLHSYFIYLTQSKVKKG